MKHINGGFNITFQAKYKIGNFYKLNMAHNSTYSASNRLGPGRATADRV